MRTLRIIGLLLLAITPFKLFAADMAPQQLQLPPHFKIEIYAASVNGARQMALGTKGTLFVGTLHTGKLYAITPDKKIITLASNLNMPNGVAFHNNALYVAENDRIVRFDDIENHLDKLPKPVLIKRLPNKTHHGWRYIAFGPDGKLYIGIGAPCNICLSKEDYFATIMRMNPDGSDFEIYAKGIRNTVGFDWNPTTHQLWFTENGRDWLGDDIPPDELNIVEVKGSHFGFPFCHASMLDPVYGKNHSCDEFVKPVLELPAHVAPLGMIFYTGTMFPQEYKNQIFIAEHGSWNRSSKVGYQVVCVKVDKNKVLSTTPFITGWLKNGIVSGRPVAFQALPDGSLLVSDDYAGVIYRVSYDGSK